LAWAAFERLFAWYWRLDDITASGDEMLRVNKVRYRGEPVELADGTLVQPGDALCELHLNRRAIARINAEATTRIGQGMAFRRALTRALRLLAEYVEGERKYRDVVALRGTSMFYESAHRAGFERVELPPNRWYRLMNWHLGRLMARDHREGEERRGERYRRLRTPGLVWMSRRALHERYGEPESREQFGERDAGEAAGGEAVEQEG
jgi:hypothetical protein